MSRHLRIAALALGVVAGAACAQSTTITTTTTPPPTSPGGDVLTVQPMHTASMRRLEESAQRLRESIRAMANKPPGPERDQAIATARHALLATQQAMVDLPPRMRTIGTMDTTSHYDKSVQVLMQAADALRDSIHTMATQPEGYRRNEAIRDANRALLDTQVAMADAFDATAFTDSTATLGGPPRQ